MSYQYGPLGPLEEYNQMAPPQNFSGQGRQYAHLLEGVAHYQEYAQPRVEPIYEYDTDLQNSASGTSGGVDQVRGTFFDQVSNFRGEHQHHQPVTGTRQWDRGGYQQPGDATMAFADQQAEQAHSRFAPVQPRALEVSYRSIPQQSRSVGGSPLSYETEHRDGFLVGCGFVPGWQPLRPQSRLSMESLDLVDLLEGTTGFNALEANRVPNELPYEDESVNADQDDDMMSERSLDLDECIKEYNVALQELGPSASSRYEPVLYNNQPWSSLTASDNYIHQSSLCSDVHRLSDRIEVPTTDRSTDTGQTIESNWVMREEMSSVSSFSQETPEDMAGSGVALRQQDLRLVGHNVEVNYTDLNQMNPNLSLQDEDETGQHLIPGLAPLHLLPTTHNKELLLPPPQSGHSDATSTTGSCRSVPDIIHCQEQGCRAKFKGKYCKGNYARHKRNKHKGPVPIVCDSPGCVRVFKRKDARLKHYRKHHPELASDPVQRPKCVRAQRPAPYDQEFELFRVGSGLS